MHTYKFIYMYEYILCTKRFVVIFVVIVWKTTLNTLEKLERDYLRGLFEGDHLRRIIWGGPFEEDHLGGSGGEIFDKRGRDGILRQTAWILRISTNKTCLFAHVWYPSSLNILSRPPLSNISPPLPFLPKWSFPNGPPPNDPPQMVPFE
jgi:hypothetical protein